MSTSWSDSIVAYLATNGPCSLTDLGSRVRKPPGATGKLSSAVGADPRLSVSSRGVVTLSQAPGVGGEGVPVQARGGGGGSIGLLQARGRAAAGGAGGAGGAAAGGAGGAGAAETAARAIGLLQARGRAAAGGAGAGRAAAGGAGGAVTAAGAIGLLQARGGGSIGLRQARGGGSIGLRQARGGGGEAGGAVRAAGAAGGSIGLQQALEATILDFFNYSVAPTPALFPSSSSNSLPPTFLPFSLASSSMPTYPLECPPTLPLSSSYFTGGGGFQQDQALGRGAGAAAAARPARGGVERMQTAAQPRLWSDSIVAYLATNGPCSLSDLGSRVRKPPGATGKLSSAVGADPRLSVSSRGVVTLSQAPGVGREGVPVQARGGGGGSIGLQQARGRAAAGGAGAGGAAAGGAGGAGAAETAARAIGLLQARGRAAAGGAAAGAGAGAAGGAVRATGAAGAGGAAAGGAAAGAGAGATALAIGLQQARGRAAAVAVKAAGAAGAGGAAAGGAGGAGAAETAARAIGLQQARGRAAAGGAAAGAGAGAAGGAVRATGAAGAGGAAAGAGAGAAGGAVRATGAAGAGGAAAGGAAAGGAGGAGAAETAARAIGLQQARGRAAAGGAAAGAGAGAAGGAVRATGAGGAAAGGAAAGGAETAARAIGLQQARGRAAAAARPARGGVERMQTAAQPRLWSDSIVAYLATNGPCSLSDLGSRVRKPPGATGKLSSAVGADPRLSVSSRGVVTLSQAPGVGREGVPVQARGGGGGSIGLQQARGGEGIGEGVAGGGRGGGAAGGAAAGGAGASSLPADVSGVWIDEDAFLLHKDEQGNPRAYAKEVVTCLATISRLQEGRVSLTSLSFASDGMQLVEDGAVPLPLDVGESLELDIRLLPQVYGFLVGTINFHFADIHNQNFSITRNVSLRCCRLEELSLIGRRFVRKEPFLLPPGSVVFSEQSLSSSGFVTSLKHGEKAIERRIERMSPEQLSNYMLSLKSHLPETYVPFFSCLVVLEHMSCSRKVINEGYMPDSQLLPEGGYFSLHIDGLAERRPSILPGDNVQVWRNPQTRYRGYVRSVRRDSVLLKFPSQFGELFRQHTRLNLLFEPNAFSTRMQLQCLRACGDFLGNLFPEVTEQQQQVGTQAGEQFEPFNSTLNQEQAQAVRCIHRHVLGSSSTAPYIIFGPPGTGKSVTVVEAILQLHFNSNVNILACAPSNAAADLLVERLSASLDPQKMFRHMASCRPVEAVPSKVLRYSKYNRGTESFEFPGLSTFTNYRVVISTCTAAMALHNHGVHKGFFGVVFVDEAGTAHELEAVGAAFALLHRSGKLVLAGDPKQLGPVIFSDTAAKLGLSLSLLERLMEYGLYQPGGAGGDFDPRYVTMLHKNYRSHPAIIKYPSDRFYLGKLEAHGDEGLIRALEHWEHLPRQGFPILVKCVEGINEQEDASPSWFNTTECVEVVEYVQLLTRSIPGLRLSDIGIITPYSRQVKKIKDLLAIKRIPNGERGLTVATTELVQGLERRIIIISTVRSDPLLLNSDAHFNLGFVNSPKRFNVAVTRAQSLMIVVGNLKCLATDPMWRDFLEYCIQHDALISDRNVDRCQIL